jgi:hypothetical protein
MANTNLFKSVQQGEDASDSIKKAKRGFVLPSIFLFIVILAWGGLKAYSMIETKKISNVEAQIISESRSLQGKDADRVADFQGRLDKIFQINNAKIDANNLFAQFQNTIVQGSQASTFSYDGNLSVKFLCDNFNVVAREIMSFKKSSYFGGTTIESISRDNQTGKVALTLSIPIKNQK